MLIVLYSIRSSKTYNYFCQKLHFHKQSVNANNKVLCFFLYETNRIQNYQKVCAIPFSVNETYSQLCHIIVINLEIGGERNGGEQ